MEVISNILQQFGKGGTFVALFLATVGLFSFIERNSSKQARVDFAKYLKSTDFTKQTMHLPPDTLLLVQRVFGAHHFTLKCIKRSILFSMCAIIVLFGISVMDNPARHAYLKASLTLGYNVNRLLFWIAWSIVIDYFNLLKTRVVLTHLVAHQEYSAWVLPIILIVDFFIGLFIFSFGGLFTEIASLSLNFSALRLISTIDAFSIIVSYMAQAWGLGIGGVLFWAGMLPSVWLWLYLVATLITRLAARSVSLLRFMTYFFDVEKHPIRSVGVVAAVVVTSSYASSLAISRLVATFLQ